MFCLRAFAPLLAAVTVLTTAGCGAGLAPLAASRLAMPAASRSTDATPRAIVKLLDRDGDGLIAEGEAWVSGKAGSEAFKNFRGGDSAVKPLATAVVERALAGPGELVLHGLVGPGPDGRGVSLTSSAAARLAQGLAAVLATDALSKAGQVPVRMLVARTLRSDLDEVQRLGQGDLSAQVQELLGKPGLDARVKLVSDAAKPYKLVLSDKAILF